MTRCFNDLYTFNVVVQKTSFLEAAKALSTTHTTILRQVTKLEDSLKTKLFHRSNKGLELTYAGQELYQRTKKLYSDLSHVVDDIALSNTLSDGKSHTIKALLSVGMSMFFINYVYPELCQKFPNYTLEIDTYTLPTLDSNAHTIKMMSHQYDIILMESSYYHLIQEDAWQLVQSCHDHLALFASEEYIAEHGMPQTLEELANHNCLYPNMWDKNIWTFYDKYKNEYKVSVKGKLTVDILSLIPQMIIAGHGIGLCPKRSFNMPHLQNANIVQVLPQYHSVQYEYNILQNIQSSHSAIARVIASKIKEVATRLTIDSTHQVYSQH
ncbi:MULTISPECIES: LysR family transcriptional regulator [Cysteiniphilum]|uniref:LysR family transcriptional regulator n=1 Tax=Cysteiniphilum TaxID=2056696 RepID=UPI0017861BAD|nr:MULTISPECIES: LysR family transcriptional regulator [Cysteiniphilum]